MDDLLAANAQLYEGSNFNIYSAVRLIKNAFKLGPEIRAGLVIAEQNWRGIVERNYL